MQKMLGDNLKNGSIAKVERSPFARADLEHQLLMVDDDMKMEALKSTHYLKSLITAEMPMDLERKGEQSYQGQMYVRFLAFSNGDLESLYDHSDGFYRRQLILSVKKKPADREDDPFLADKLCDEIDGIFLWCLEGLRRLIGNNYRFTESARTRDNRVEAKQEADNVLLFLRSEGYIRLKADSTITSVDLYAIYTMWCNDNTYKPLAARTVSMTLKKHADEFGLEGTCEKSKTQALIEEERAKAKAAAEHALELAQKPAAKKPAAKRSRSTRKPAATKEPTASKPAAAKPAATKAPATKKPVVKKTPAPAKATAKKPVAPAKSAPATKSAPAAKSAPARKPTPKTAE